MKILKCEGYKMFEGTAKIVPINVAPYDVTGVWLYKPDYNCWYCNGRSYPAEIVQIEGEE